MTSTGASTTWSSRRSSAWNPEPGDPEPEAGPAGTPTAHVGDDLLAQARRGGIDGTHVVRRSGVPTGLIVEVLEPAGRWHYLEHLPGAMLLTEADVTAAADAFRRTDAVLVQLQQPPAAALAAARLGRAAGALVVLDAYRVVSTDGHPGQGAYPFTVADPSSTATPIASPPTDTPPAATTVKDDRGPGVGVLVAGSTLTVLVVPVGGLRRRAARR